MGLGLWRAQSLRQRACKLLLLLLLLALALLLPPLKCWMRRRRRRRNSWAQQPLPLRPSLLPLSLAAQRLPLQPTVMEQLQLQLLSPPRLLLPQAAPWRSLAGMRRAGLAAAAGTRVAAARWPPPAAVAGP